MFASILNMLASIFYFLGLDNEIKIFRNLGIEINLIFHMMPLKANPHNTIEFSKDRNYLMGQLIYDGCICNHPSYPFSHAM